MPKAYYMGKRMVGRVPRHSMCDDEGGTWHYPKAKDHMFWGAIIGHEYETEEKDNGDDGFKLPSAAGWHGADTGVIHPNRDRWQADHRLAIEKKKASSEEPAPELMQHVNALRAAVGHMSAPQRVTFLAYLISTFTSWRV